LPPTVQDLPLILVKDSKNSDKSKEFRVNRNNIRNALFGLSNDEWQWV